MQFLDKQCPKYQGSMPLNGWGRVRVKSTVHEHTENFHHYYGLSFLNFETKMRSQNLLQTVDYCLDLQRTMSNGENVKFIIFFVYYLYNKYKTISFQSNKCKTTSFYLRQKRGRINRTTSFCIYSVKTTSFCICYTNIVQKLL